MPIINYSRKEIQLKVVYYGPAQCGKTANMRHIHSRVATECRGGMVSLPAEAARSTLFDLLTLNTAAVQGFRTTLQLYHVSGQVIYNATRQLVLRGVDGVVFMADSRWEKMEENVASLRELEDNLLMQNRSLDEVPWVLQYNKRDLPDVAPVSYLEYALNHRAVRAPSFEASAVTGQNVFAALNAILQLLLPGLTESPREASPWGIPSLRGRGAHGGLPRGGTARPGAASPDPLPATLTRPPIQSGTSADEPPRH